MPSAYQCQIIRDLFSRIGVTHTVELPAPRMNTIARMGILSMEHNSGPSFQQCVQQRVSLVPQVGRSCLKKKGKEFIEPAVKSCVSFDLEKNEV